MLLSPSTDAKLRKVINTTLGLGVLAGTGFMIFVVAYEFFYLDWKSSRIAKDLRESYLVHAAMGNVPKPSEAQDSLYCERVCSRSMPSSVTVVVESGDTLVYHGIKRTNPSDSQKLVYNFEFIGGFDTNSNVITNAPSPR